MNKGNGKDKKMKDNNGDVKELLRYRTDYLAIIDIIMLSILTITVIYFWWII